MSPFILSLFIAKKALESPFGRAATPRFLSFFRQTRVIPQIFRLVTTFLIYVSTVYLDKSQWKSCALILSQLQKYSKLKYNKKLMM